MVAQPIETLDITAREIEILALVADGLTNQEIALRTGLKLNTVKWYLKEIYSKLYVGNRTEAVARAREWNLFDEAPAESQAPASADPRATQSLPFALTPFVGREREGAALVDLLTDPTTRIVTLHGIGGIGKTRLAIEVARSCQEQFADGIVYVPLTAARSAAAGITMIAATFGLTGPSATVADIIGVLRHKNVLLVLDNLEHILEISPELSALLAKASRAVILATSRQALNLHGEIVYTIHGLTDDDDEVASAADLFEQVARTNQPDFTLTEHTLPAVESICRLVGGMPLAIELAAAWVGMLDVAAIEAEIRQGLDILESDAWNLPERHRSVRAIIDGSWRHLAPAAQQALTRLAVFPDSFTYEAAHAITEAGLPVLRKLLSSALIRRRGTQRFGMHDLVRQYAAARLKADRAESRAAYDRHAEYFLDFAHKQGVIIKTSADVRRVGPIATEMDNIIAAWKHAVENYRCDWLEPAVDMGYYVDFAQRWDEFDALFGWTMASIPDCPELIARILVFRSLFAYCRRDTDQALALGNEAIPLLEASDRLAEAAMAVGYNALTYAVLKEREKALTEIVRSWALLERSDDPPMYIRLAIAGIHGSIHLYANEYEETIGYFVNLLHDLPPDVTWLVGSLRVYVGECYLALGERDTARRYFDDGYEVGMLVKDPLAVAGAVLMLTKMDTTPETFPQALIDQLHEIVDAFGSALLVGHALIYFGSYLYGRQQFTDARTGFLAGLLVLATYDEVESAFAFCQQIANTATDDIDLVRSMWQIASGHDQSPADLHETARQALANLGSPSPYPFDPDEPLRTIIRRLYDAHLSEDN